MKKTYTIQNLYVPFLYSTNTLDATFMTFSLILSYNYLSIACYSSASSIAHFCQYNKIPILSFQYCTIMQYCKTCSSLIKGADGDKVCWWIHSNECIAPKLGTHNQLR